MITNIYYYKSNFIKIDISLENIKSSGIFSLLSVFPFLFLFFIFVKALNNNYSFIKKEDFYENLVCKEGQTLKPIIFNSNSGFFMSTYQKEIKKNYKNFSEILDVYADKSVILKKFNFDHFFSMTREEINNRDSFKVLEKLIMVHNGRIFQLSERERLNFKTLVTQFLTSEAFYIRPINYKKKNLDDIILLKTDLVNKGINTVAICM